MIIANIQGHKVDVPSIGHIRAKHLPADGHWELSIWPPQYSGAFADGSTLVEIEVSQEEAERIERVAPHLLSGVTQPSVSDRYRLGLPMKKRAGPAKGASHAQSGT